MPLQVFYKKSCSEKICNTIFTRTINKVLLKMDSNTDALLWILGNFKEHLFWRTSAYGCSWRDFRKWLFSLLLSDWRVAFKTTLFSNQSFKHNSAHMPSLNLTSKLYFEPRFRMFIINSYYRKKKAVVVPGLFIWFVNISYCLELFLT